MGRNKRDCKFPLGRERIDWNRREGAQEKRNDEWDERTPTVMWIIYSTRAGRAKEFGHNDPSTMKGHDQAGGGSEVVIVLPRESSGVAQCAREGGGWTGPKGDLQQERE